MSNLLSINTYVFTIVLLVLVCYFLYRHIRGYDKRIATMAFDGKEYLVRDIPSRVATADALARLNRAIKILIDYMEKSSHPDFVLSVKRLKNRYNSDAISEGHVTDAGITSYTLNKGEEIVFCMRTRDNEEQLYEDNVLMYVAMHELAHVMTISEQHTSEFHTNFRYLQECARKLKLFEGINKSTNYCGIDLKPQH